MSKFSFIHTSDLHLDSPFKGISRMNDELGELCKNSTFNAFKNIINIAIKREVDFVLFAGDIFDSSIRSLAAQSSFFKGLEDLNLNDIRSYIVHGNHDPTNEWLSSFKYPSLATVISCDDIESIPVTDKNDIQIATIRALSFRNKECNINMVNNFPQKDDHYFNIGLLHCSVGDDEEHSTYAPCSMNDIRLLNYDYWALGHIHKPKILQQEYPCVVYCGTPQGRSSKECGEHGCYYVEVDNNTISNFEFTTTDVIRWLDFKVDITNIESFNEMLDLIDQQLNALRSDNYNLEAILLGLSIDGKSDLHKELVAKRDEIIDLINDYCETEASFPKIYIQKLNLLTKSITSIEDLKKNDDFISYLLNKIDEARTNDDLFNQIKAELNPLIQNSSLKNFFDESLTNPDEIRKLLNEVEERCIDLFSE
ncbi:MAG: DNA repair exonuclease [Cyanobacteriota bacterium]